MNDEKYCFYARYFTENTKTQQLTKMLKFIEENHIPIKNTIYLEDYGKGSTQTREGLNKLLKLAFEGEFRQLVILIPEILHIDYVEFKKIQQDLTNYGVNIIRLVAKEEKIDIPR